ncbi:MAG: 1,4-alpha-glucan branching enzyme, partial [Acidocella sp.]|nr:1,4-alpha-glucan branching enzyme [Acidocella sp.]
MTAGGDHSADRRGLREGTLTAYLPEALSDVLVLDQAGGEIGKLRRLEGADLFKGRIDALPPLTLCYETQHGARQEVDPYSLPPFLTDFDLYLLAEGNHQNFSALLGANVGKVSGVQGVGFAVWAPNATRVSVVGDFNHWDGCRHPMRARPAGMWEIFIPAIRPGSLYKFEILDRLGRLLPLKADPVAFDAEIAPGTASIVAPEATPIWTDAGWMAEQSGRDARREPMSIYEIHVKSWIALAGQGESGWAVLARRLVPYLSRMGFTHVELMPVMGHPFGGSWGYQPLSMFAPMPEMGTAIEFAQLVDLLHAHGIGIILDWVPGHFPADGHGLVQFDGTAIYEHEDPREGFHPDWNTLIYNFGRNEVRGFLVGSALYWIEQFHIDGLRVDAVASMLYRDYSRQPGQWRPNRYGGRENLEAVEFLRHLNSVVHARCPGVLMIAEESTAWPGVTRPVQAGGLGFDFKWNMGWMHDSLRYIGDDPVYRPWAHERLTFGLLYAWSEAFILPISHDEVV